MISRNARHDQPMPPLRGAGCITVSFRPAIPRRPGRTSLTRGNVGGSHTPGKRTAETALAGCAERLQRTRLHRLNFPDPREELRLAMKAAGFSPIPCKGKRPALDDWPNLVGVPDDEIVEWPNWVFNAE